MANATSARLVPACDLLLEDAAELIFVDPLEPHPLGATAVAGHDLDGGVLDAERLGDQVHDGLVGPAAGGGRGDLDLDGITVPAGHLGAPGARHDMEPHDHIDRFALTGNIK